MRFTLRLVGDSIGLCSSADEVDRVLIGLELSQC
jgi:hypothetical protein